jgi:hypothetical protein|tara:strand:- start:80 stop:340 length:261 start_codon:yes stop_codon:yes gene_type:complete
MLDDQVAFRKMVDDIKNDRFELEDKSEGYSSMEIPEPKVVAAEPEAAVEEPVAAAEEEPTTTSSDSNTDSPSSHDDDFDEKHDHKK